MESGKEMRAVRFGLANPTSAPSRRNHKKPAVEMTWNPREFRITQVFTKPCPAVSPVPESLDSPGAWSQQLPLSCHTQNWAYPCYNTCCETVREKHFSTVLYTRAEDPVLLRSKTVMPSRPASVSRLPAVVLPIVVDPILSAWRVKQGVNYLVQIRVRIWHDRYGTKQHHTASHSIQWHQIVWALRGAPLFSPGLCLRLIHDPTNLLRG